MRSPVPLYLEPPAWYAVEMRSIAFAPIKPELGRLSAFPLIVPAGELDKLATEPFATEHLGCGELAIIILLDFFMLPALHNGNRRLVHPHLCQHRLALGGHP
jgi:hypothetical protein